MTLHIRVRGWIDYSAPSDWAIRSYFCPELPGNDNFRAKRGKP